MSDSAFTSALPPSMSPGPVRVAVVESDPAARRLMRYWLENAGYEVLEAANVSEAERFASERPDIACIDLGIGGNAESGVAVLRMLHSLDPRLPAVMVAAQRDVESAVGAMRAGAYDYVVKPLDSERLLRAMERARDRHQIVRSAERPESGARRLGGLLSGRSRVIRDLERAVAKVIDRDVAVLLIGEEGSGKELLARTIHDGSARAGGPFVAFDCSSVEPTLHEAKLFGGDGPEGRTGRGLYEQASGGVLYLEHIDSLSLEAQATLALSMSGRPSRRPEAGNVVSANVRIIAGSTTNLRAESEAGKFREELFFRLVVFPLEVPSLKQRSEDIPHIVGHLIREHGSRFGGGVPDQIAPEALEVLSGYEWPGNLRQLENVVQRGLIAATGRAIQVADLPPEVRGGTPVVKGSAVVDFASADIVPLRELERRAIEHALRVTHGSVSLAAKRLGIGRATLYRRIASLDLSLDVA